MHLLGRPYFGKDWHRIKTCQKILKFTPQLDFEHDAFWTLLFVGQQPGHHLLRSDLVNNTLLSHFEEMPSYLASNLGIIKTWTKPA